MFTAGVDYKPVMLAVTFETNEFMKCFSDFSVFDDAEIEKYEKFNICLFTNSTAVTLGTTKEVTVNILNDDGENQFTMNVIF